MFADRGLTTPDGVETTIESVSTYRPDIDARFAMLTTREREVLTTAIDEGYYQNPRQAIHADLATKLDISAGAVERTFEISRQKSSALISSERRGRDRLFPMILLLH
jgi:predicted DNA binding protein